MKNFKSLLLFPILILLSTAAFSQTGRVKWKQIEGGTQGQIAIVGIDGNGSWVTPVFLKWSDTTNFIATKYDKSVLEGKVVNTAGFSGGTLTLTKVNGTTVTVGLDGRYILLSEKAAVNGVASLGADGKVPSSQLPAQSAVDVYTAASQAAMLALSQATQGDYCIRTDTDETYVLNGSDPSVLSNWVLLPQGSGVTSVNGDAGPNVTLTTDDISEGTTNKYFSNTLARLSITGTAPINFNQTTGVITHATSGITANTSYNNVQFDTYGHAISASNVAYLVAADLSPYETKANLSGNGTGAVHWNNLTNVPSTLGGTEKIDEYTGSTSSTLTLTQTPKTPAGVKLYYNGVLLQKADYTVSGTTVTLGFTRTGTDYLSATYLY